MRQMLVRMTALFLGLSMPMTAAWAQQGNPESTAALAKNSNPTRDLLSPAAINRDYRIGATDVLDVHVWRESELSRVIPVRPDGKVSLPLVGELHAGGKTAEQLGQEITERLKEYVTHPVVTVIIQQINSQRYFVLGEVQRPGVYPLTIPTTVMQALAMVGGFREFANTNEILILRRTEGDSTVRIRFSYKDWVKNKKRLEHMELKNGDLIVVP